ncbi:MAG: RNA polymerase factor sigma-54 [Desulfobacterales bacterium]|nr:RNA polymerase factor sigma-54 [Desulfobacterales bacterium]
MGIELRQNLQLSQQLIMTPQLQQAIKLLQLSRLELMDVIQQELEQNPALEEVQEPVQDIPSIESPPEEFLTTGITSAQQVEITEKVPNDMDWDNYLDEYNSTSKVQYEFEDKDSPSYESYVAEKKSLTEHLMWQLVMISPSKQDHDIGRLIINSLDKDGYLDIELQEIERLSGADMQDVERVLYLLQTFDPIGVCALDLRDCLLIQARHLGLDDTLVTDIIQDHIKHLENKNYKAICKALKITMEEVIQAVNIIREFEPKPGRLFYDDAPVYIIPDIFVYKVETDFLIFLNDDGLPKLHINPYYKKAIEKGEKIPANTKDYLQEKMNAAAWLIKSIHQRQKTIYSVMKSIVKFQREFFEKGSGYLKPMVLRDVATDISMHESTISRVTTNKYAFTPQGTFELKYFFNSSVNSVVGDALASMSVKEKIKQIIENEDPRNPYSDDKIVEILKKSNIDIARRTVAKYRDMMNILSSNKRKQY